MSTQNNYNLNDYTSETQMFYVQIDDPNIIETPVESQAIPMNMLLNAHNEHYLLPLLKDKQQAEQLCFYVEPTDNGDDQSLQNYINNQRYLVSTNGNVLSIQTNSEISNKSAMLQNNESLPSTSGKASIANLKQDNTKTKLPDSKKHTSKVQGFVHLADRVVPPRAVAVLPAALQMRRERIVPKRPLPERVRFGPVLGIIKTKTCSEARDMILDAALSKTPIFLLKNGDSVKHIDVSDRDKSNWFSLLPLGTESTANVWLYEEDNKLYGITVESVAPQTQLALGYSKQYAQDHEIPPGFPILDLSQDLSSVPRRWWCYECHRALPTASQLQLHVDDYHKEKITSTRRYRCRHCTRTFGRRFTLKRHIARYCCKKPEKIEPLNKVLTAPDIGLSTNLNVEDNRLPSDESLQNYTNGLDFSTSLFDTDRMPGLDISGSSRSETEFNAYSLPYKDDGLDLALDKFANDLDETGNKDKRKTIDETLTILISCPYCKQTILREKKREHLRECPEKMIFDCECGITFKSAERLAQHVQSVHTDKAGQPELSEANQSNGCEYKCEKCQHTFKRRGMLVNHMWRAHAAAARVPLQRRVRLHPCGACHKLYRSAAKRDAHRALHHPGADLIRGQTIESGRRTIEPAACDACPRQYATRAKLMQHVRQHHPHLAPPIKRNQKTTRPSSGSTARFN